MRPQKHRVDDGGVDTRKLVEQDMRHTEYFACEIQVNQLDDYEERTVCVVEESSAYQGP